MAAINFIWIACEPDAFNHRAALQRDIGTFDFQVLDQGDVVAILQFIAVGVANFVHEKLSENGDPGWIRTNDLPLRRRLL